MIEDSSVLWQVIKLFFFIHKNIYSQLMNKHEKRVHLKCVIKKKSKDKY